MTRRISVSVLVGGLLTVGLVVAGAGRGSAQVEHAVVTITPAMIAPVDFVCVQSAKGWTWSGPDMGIATPLRPSKSLVQIAADLGLKAATFDNGIQLVDAMVSEGWELVGPAATDQQSSTFTLRIRR